MGQEYAETSLPSAQTRGTSVYRALVSGHSGAVCVKKKSRYNKKCTRHMRRGWRGLLEQHQFGEPNFDVVPVALKEVGFVRPKFTFVESEKPYVQ